MVGSLRLPGEMKSHVKKLDHTLDTEEINQNSNLHQNKSLSTVVDKIII